MPCCFLHEVKPALVRIGKGKRMNYSSIMAFLLGSVLSSVVSAEAPWRIVSLADWHSSEGGVMAKNPAAFARNQASEKQLIVGSVACKPDVVIIAGDVGSGHWILATARKVGVLQ